MTTKSIDYIIKEIDMALAGVENDFYKITTALSDADIDYKGMREIEPNKMYDLDCNDYTITLHYYESIQDLPKNCITIGSTFYMYPTVEIAEPTYIGMCSIVEVFNTNYNTQYAIYSKGIL